MNREITVIGAGIVGVACARRLQQEGHDVRLLDPLPPGHGCSWGNAGMFATDSVIPLATPATLASVPPMLLRSDAAVALRWQYLPRLLPWLARFVANARPARVEANTRALTALCRAADAGTAALIADSAAAALIHPSGWLTVYETPKGLASGRREAAERNRRGVACEVLSRAEVQAYLPEAADHIVGGLRSPDCSMCEDPGGMVARLADDFEQAGGTIVRQRAHRLVTHAEGIGIEADHDEWVCEHVVLATGVETTVLARQIGDRFPLDTERGYHVMIPEAGIRPALPVMAGEHKFVTTPMAHGLRLAGLTELGGTRLPAHPARCRTILKHARRIFPELQAGDWTEWLGFRPTLPDSLPVIGRSPRNPRVTYAFGHQHLGLTLAGLTAQLVVDDLAGREAPIDMAPVSPARWQ